MSAGKFLATVLGIGLVVGGCTTTCSITNRWKVSEGDRVGMVNKISRKGYFWDTFEGQMALEGISSSGSSIGANVWDFAIDNYWPQEKQDAIANQLREVMDSGQKVKIHYQEMACTLPWRSGSNHLIQSIEPIGSIEKAAVSAERPANANYRQNPNGTAATIDGRHYLLWHDSNGYLKADVLTTKQNSNK